MGLDKYRTDFFYMSEAGFYNVDIGLPIKPIDHKYDIRRCA